MNRKQRRQQKKRGGPGMPPHPGFMPGGRAPDTTLLLETALAHQSVGRLDQMKTACLKVLIIEPRNALANNLLGIAAVQTGDGTAAISYFETAVAREPRNPVYQNNLGNAYTTAERRADAVNHFQKALELAPDYGEARNNLGIALVKMGRYQEAVATYKTAVKYAGDIPQIHCNLGEALDLAGFPEQAVSSYHRALEIDANDATIYFGLAVTLQRLGDYPRATENFDRTIELNPDYVEAYISRARLGLLGLGSNLEAESEKWIDELRDLLSRRGKTTKQRALANFALGDIHNAISKYDDAFEYFKEANDAMARIRPFDMAADRQLVLELKDAFTSHFPLQPTSLSQSHQRTPIFVIGLSRSGKSLIESAIAETDGVFPAGEHGYLRDALYDVARKKGLEYGTITDMAALSTQHGKEIGNNFRSILSSVAPEARYTIHTSPMHHVYIGLILRSLPEAKIIYVRRDPVDNCLMNYMAFYEQAHVTGNNYAYALDSIATRHDTYRQIMGFWQDRAPSQIFNVRYEDFVRDPVSVCAALSEHCDLPIDGKLAAERINAKEVGIWRHYERHLQPLLELLDSPNQDDQIAAAQAAQPQMPSIAINS